jgi:hypothetical protein
MKYHIKEGDEVRGPFMLSQLSRMWATGNLTADAFYRLENVEDWSSITDLAETLESLSQNSPTPIAESSQTGTIGLAGTKEEVTKGAPPLLSQERERAEAKAEFEKLRDEMINGPRGRKIQSMLASQFLAKGLFEGNREMIAHLENVAEGRPIPVRLLTGDECQERAIAFRRKWALLHLVFWIIIGFAWLGTKAALGIFLSLIILAVQVDWKKRQLLREMGLTKTEVNKRVPPLV